MSKRSNISFLGDNRLAAVNSDAMQVIQPDPSSTASLPPAALEKNHRLLIVDDNEAIHADFRKILQVDANAGKFDAAEAAVLKGTRRDRRQRADFEMDFAFQGAEALQCVQRAVTAGRRYAMVFMDMRMPPGWNGLETARKIWEADPDLQVVLCTSYSDYSWDDLMKEVESPERLLILKKPFDAIEVLQFSHALTEKWSLLQAARLNASALQHLVDERTEELRGMNETLQAEIIERKHAEEQALNSEAALAIAQQVAHVGSWELDLVNVVDLDKNVLRWSNETCRIFGCVPGETAVTNDLFFGIVHPADRAGIVSGIASLLNSRVPYCADYRIVLSGGEERVVHEVAELIIDEGTKCPLKIVGTVQDITARKKLEEKFLRVQRMESIGTLASGIAHDLNNVLAPIMMSVEMLKEMVDTNAGRSLLTTLQSCAQRGADLVKQVLSFAKGVEGKRVIVNVFHLLRDIEKIIHETFPKNILFKLKSSRGVWNVMADPTQLHQVFMNLCVNARDAMPNGGQLSISLENIVLDETYAAMNPESKAGSYLCMRVSDTGTGIPPGVLNKIFEPFFTTKEIGRGTGLGLSTTLAIVRSHGGFINVYSEPGKGSSFGVFLVANTSEISSAEAPTERADLPRGGDELILIVDDEESIRIIAKKTLERFGYRTLLAGNGAEAVGIYAKYHSEIAVVLTDMAMPIMDGPALIIALKTIEPQVLIIASSGHASQGIVTKTLSVGVEYFIPKPYTAEILLCALKTVITRKTRP
ncbi:MAG: domain S-box [Verrucomicrobiales bacterium]|nr:domain S-box [Verrucomicrobiales bacterium]